MNFIFQIIVLFLLPYFVLASTENIQYETQMFSIDGQQVQIKLPRGYQLELLNDSLDGPRLFSFADNGDLFIGSKSGRVYRLKPPYKHAEVLIKLSDYPHSVAIRGNQLLIARTSGLYVTDFSFSDKKISRKQLKLLAPLPGGGGHNSRTVAVGPDNRIYLSLGISGNCSDEYISDEYEFDDRRGGVLVLDESSSKPNWQAFATGLRNPVGFDWHPATKIMYASNNGPDHHGFESPPEYFSKLEENSFHGMPWFQFDGEKIFRDKCIPGKPPENIQQVKKPVVTFLARNAPMGVAFVPKDGMDKRFEHDAIVALRGSWATKPGGSYWGDNATRRHPKLVMVRFDNGKAISVDDLLTGFQLKDGDRWARPVGVKVGPDGAVYFTSDSGVNGLFRLSKVK